MISQVHISDGFNAQDMHDIQTWAEDNLIDETPGDILFQTSFDGGTNIVYKSSGHEVIGTDSQGTQLPYDIPGSGIRLGEESEGIYANFFNYSTSGLDLTDPVVFEEYFKTYIETGLTIPGSATTTSLVQQFIKDYTGDQPLKARNQYNIRADPNGDIYNRLDQGYIKFKNFIHIDGITNPQTWSLPWEWKQDGDRNSRFGLYINDPMTTPVWYLQVQDFNTDQTPGDIIFDETNTEVAVPLDEWFDMEIFWVGSGESDGKIQVAVNGVEIFTYNGRTKKSGSDDVLYYMGVMKVYGVSATIKTTDMIWAKEPISGSVLPGSGA